MSYDEGMIPGAKRTGQDLKMSFVLMKNFCVFMISGHLARRNPQESEFCSVMKKIKFPVFFTFLIFHLLQFSKQ